ncbi:peptidoglycan binding domain-containing protein [Nostoc commune NIES-4072]|uniref:Peptidoglycan binding domain-containing protein n=1 Tax=Nostoc commune NIES-4072 TaxID=2005467 RepID=A0A2R5FTZ7_NOSCO|nr:peptidoglycan-binding protein [Nostoc commune]BBD69854.1 peptidoglycan binding domain-containing protein [Nostoc commune HK-02]GBG19144.1 peptidoglycan binding domain-containing protein [Nostoc commune NIES-4072]
METGVDSYLTKLASVYEASKSVKVVPSVANFKFKNLEKLYSGAAMRLLSVALITWLLSIAGQALALQKIGSNGAEVSTSQRCLKKLGYFNGPVTGKFASLTQNAVIKFQQANRIPADGVVGASTQRALQRACQSRTFSRSFSPTPSRAKLSTQQVKELQVRLRQLGYFNTAATGNVGPMTKKAVTRFQQNYRLPVNGIANAQVLEAVRRASTGGYTTQQPGRSYLTVGDQGENVRLVQERLSQLGFSNTNPDGFFSDYTRGSVIAFQQSSRLNSTGNVDWQTWEALGLNNSNASNSTETNGYVFSSNNDYVAPQTNRYALPPTNGYVVPVSNGNTLVANNPYRVIVPISNNDTLSKVQQYIPTAVTEQSHLGDYVNAGAFSDRAQAETLTKKLRSLGIDARVKYN